jgi:hypothetical protein
MCHRITFCFDPMLKHRAANSKRQLSALPNVGPHIYDVKISGFTRSSIYTYDISRLRVKENINKTQQRIFECSPTKYLHDHIQWWEYINYNAREIVKHTH